MHHVDKTYADVRVDMGKANRLGPGQAVVGGRTFNGLAVDVGNPHLACVDSALTVEALGKLDVAAPVSFDHDQFPDGVNVEILTAPVDGVVVTRGIDPGATVVASFQAPVLFVIAQDLHKMKILADVDEADVGKIAEGMDADCVVDAFPGEVFHGKVSQIRYSANNVSGVVTYPGVVEVDNPEEKLRPGMTSTITVRTHEVHGVSRIPNAALRYKPTPATGPDGKPVVSPPEPPLEKGKGRVWVLTADKPGSEKDESRIVSIGITDGMFTAVTDPALPVGTKVVTDENETEKEKDQKKKAK